MIVGTSLLIAGAATLLVLGLWQSSSVLLSGSIAASLLAAVVLVVGTRRAAVGVDDPSADPTGATGVDRWSGSPGQGPEGEAPTVTIPTQGSQSRGTALTGQSTRPPAEDAPAGAATVVRDPVGGTAAGPAGDGDPPDEPAAQQVSAADAARVSRLTAEVLVVDGRPRYHLTGCVHLLARESEPLPVAEALELGFTPCGLCEPDSALLAEARRV